MSMCLAGGCHVTETAGTVLPWLLGGEAATCQCRRSQSGRSPGGGNGIHSRILAWEIPWTEESGGLQSMGSQESQT